MFAYKQKTKKRTIHLLALILTVVLADSPAMSVFVPTATVKAEDLREIAEVPSKEKEAVLTPKPIMDGAAETQELTQENTPEVTQEPTQEPTQDNSPMVTQAPDQENTPEGDETEEPSPTPVQEPAYKSKTLQLMASYDYIKNSVTGVSKEKKKLASLQKLMKKYGSLYGEGMPYEEYKEAMGYMWTDATEYGKKPVEISVDINKSINYKSYVNILKKLSRIEGVYLYK